MHRALNRQETKGADVVAAPSPPLDAAASVIMSARQDYLNALPIAAAIVMEADGVPFVAVRNEQFAMLDGMSMSVFEGSDPRPLVEREPLRGNIRAFLLTDHAATQFDWHDGGGVGGRHFIVRMARLSTSADQERRCVLSLVDRTAEIENERSLRAEMLHDSLTGLPNRVAFNEAVEQAMASEARGHFAVLAIDLTRFSRINESMGSIAGDELIITVARRIVKALRGGDMLARTGGDEFSIIVRLGEGGQQDAMIAARRLQATMATPFRLTDLEIQVDCAIGCALMSEPYGDAEDLIRNAQFALKRAKQSGDVEIYRPGEVSAARRRLGLETELRRAIENADLHLAFQPLITLSTGRVSSFEALARWEHPERGAISPVEFIPVAEECGLIVPLGRWALDAAATTLADWDRRAGHVTDAHVSVNLSAIQLARDDVVRAVSGSLTRMRIGGERLTLELTESAIIGDPERATRALLGLKDLNAKIAMDDFGTGYSSLAYLQKLPIDILKIDRSFVSGMMTDNDSESIVRAVLSLAKALGMRTTAEGVESAELANRLATLGCTWGQGYHFARPLKADDAFDYWRARNA
ncbi:MAG: EAL domain-containing protein [Sphingomonas sp.]